MLFAGVDASIQWSARGTGSTFTMANVVFYPFAGCRRRRRQLTQAQIDESKPEYQASLPSGDWWKPAYGEWAAAHGAPSLPPFAQPRRRSRRLQERVDLAEDHKPLISAFRWRARYGPLVRMDDRV